MQETARPRLAPDYQAEIMEGELVIFHPDSTKVLHSNPSAAVIWKLCDGQRTVGEIIHLLCDAFPESAEQIKKDVPEAIQLFVENGVMVLE
jgi:hypothetical protein